MMDARTSAALEASIAHWSENIAAETPDGARTGPDHCALCQEFNPCAEIDDCDGCPVFANTGRRYCAGTPYEAAHGALMMWVDVPSNPASRDEFRKHATAMRNFLIGLREVE
jgi:hypothetical protein